MKKIICDGDKCDAYFVDAYPGEAPAYWVKVEAFIPGSSTIGHLCPQCWAGDRAINFAKNRPWLLQGLGARHA